MIIGITGPTGSGKTTLLNLIRDCGGTVLDCDAIYHDLLATDEAMLCALRRRFPAAFLQGTLDRKALGVTVFHDPAALQDLNTITHTAVKKAVQAELSQNPKLAAIDAVALFEGGLAEVCDITVAVIAPEEDRIRRIMARDGISEEYARARIRAQKDPDFFRSHCGYVLENLGTWEEFQCKCLAFLREIGIIKSESAVNNG